MKITDHILANKSYSDWALRNVNLNNYERITQPLYDTAERQAKDWSRDAIRFFQIPLGQGNIRGASKTLADTNMYLPGQLPNGWFFIIEKIGLRLHQDEPNIADERKFYGQGWFQFQIMAKIYATGTPAELKEGTTDPELVISFFADDGKARCSIKTGEGFVPHILKPNDLLLAPNTNFVLALYDLPPLKRAARIRATLYGQLFRQIA